MTGAKLYEILGIAREATRDQIRAAYRRLAKEKHPDAGGTEAEFQLIKLAHDVLTDDERRKQYDETGRVDERLDLRPAVLQEVASALDEIAQTDGFAMHLDLAEGICRVLEERLNMHRQMVERADRDLDRSRKLLGRFKRRRKPKKARDDDGENLFEMLLRGRLATVERAIPQFQARVEIVERALELARQYDFEREVPVNQLGGAFYVGLQPQNGWTGIF